MVILIMITAALTTSLLLIKVEGISVQAEFVRENFRGEKIPLGMGLAFILGTLLASSLGLIVGFFGMQEMLILTLGLLGFGLLGFLDDIWGDPSAKGLKGHFQALWSGTLTTGALKAIYGGVLSLTLAFVVAGSQGIIVNGLIIALMTNALNLMDLRPGRCGKVFLLVLLGILLWGNSTLLHIFVPLAAAIMVYLPWDLRARVMMGDTGSNPLGALLGVGLVIIGGGLLALVVLLVVHVYSEKYSITKLIEANSFLSFLDKLGQS